MSAQRLELAADLRRQLAGWAQIRYPREACGLLLDFSRSLAAELYIFGRTVAILRSRNGCLRGDETHRQQHRCNT